MLVNASNTGYDSSFQRDFLPFQTVGISRSIPFFMMMEDDVFSHFQAADHIIVDFPFKIYTSNNLLDFQLCLLVTILIVTAHSVHDLEDRLNELYPDDKVYNTIQVLYTIVTKHRFVSKR